LALLALVAGLVAVVYWKKASKVFFVPISQNSSGSAFVGAADAELWVRAIVETLQKSSRLNKTAAEWTAAAVALGAVASVVGALTAPS
jgi:hypothetical protein